MKKKSLIVFIILIIILIVSIILVEKVRTKDETQIKDNVYVTKINENIIDRNIQEDIKENTNEVNVQNNILEETDELKQTDINTYANNEENNIQIETKPEISNVENNQKQENLSEEMKQQSQQNIPGQISIPVENPSNVIQEDSKVEELKFCIDGGDIHILGDGENEHRILQYMG